MKAGDIVGIWSLCKRFKYGGNGEIWLAKGDDETLVAIKFLLKVKPVPYARFKAEVHALVEYFGTKGVMPILDYSLPAGLGTTTPWYAMPVCESVEEHFAERGPTTIVEAFLPLLETLEKLHANGFSHRDIKPANILFKDDEILLADFGLVDYPDKVDVTGKGDSVGPKWTMAPEMKRKAAKADGKPADIYSLAKTLWILLTKETKGFEGQYIPDEFVGINRKSLGIYSKPLDDLLAACTQNDPSKRPTATTFKELLQHWLLLNEDYQKRNPAQWRDIQKEIFPFSTPSTAMWYDREDIVRVLNKVGSIKSLNHMFFPSGGGLDLTSARFSNEKDCIELIADGTVSVVKPKKLTLESFGFDYQWNYFRLETYELEKSNVYDEYTDNAYSEELTEIAPATYAHYNCYEYNDLNGEPLPEDARHLSRYFNGCFVFFQKTSIYTRTPSTYSATH